MATRLQGGAARGGKGLTLPRAPLASAARRQGAGRAGARADA